MPSFIFHLLRFSDELTGPISIHIVVALVVPHMEIDGLPVVFVAHIDSGFVFYKRSNGVVAHNNIENLTIS